MSRPMYNISVARGLSRLGHMTRCVVFQDSSLPYRYCSSTKALGRMIAASLEQKNIHILWTNMPVT